jgi:hypothetical protein
LHYLIYKTTCTINGKYYVGKHKTKNRDDDYLGSGKLLRAAIKKYGRKNFTREIILDCSTEDEMNLAEKILVVPDIEVNYNLCPGGQGGWGYINTNNLWDTDKRKKAAKINIKKAQIASITPEARARHSSTFKANHAAGLLPHIGQGFLNKKHTDESKMIMSLKAKERTGQRNSQFGSCWMTDGAKNVKIKRDEVDTWIEMGYKRELYI